MTIKNQIQVCAALFAVTTVVGQSPAGSPANGAIASGKTFFNVDFPNVHGNGRSCATCHVPEEAFQLTPAHVEARFQALQQRRLTDPDADDPLFRSVDANDGRRTSRICASMRSFASSSNCRKMRRAKSSSGRLMIPTQPL